ncbi:hypothetical protein ACHQM5_028103 [Ranunculus cassubicifolius]
MKNRLFYLLKSQKGFNSLRDNLVHDVGLSGFSSAVGKKAIDGSITEPVKRLDPKPTHSHHLQLHRTSISQQGHQNIEHQHIHTNILGFARRIFVNVCWGRQIRNNRVSLLSSYQFGKHHNGHAMQPFLTRSLASSSAPQSSGQPQEQKRTDISTYEDPFDAPTYNIPEKPVTFVEGASYSVAILAGLGLAAIIAYTAFTQFLLTPPESKVFGKALKRIQNESKVKDIIGTPIKGYGMETHNRSARQLIPHKIWTDEDGVEHVLVHFVIRGPRGSGNVECEMFKDSSDGQWKYTSLLVQMNSSGRRPAPVLVLESYIPPSKFTVK